MKKGFTLLEMLIVIAILAVLMGIVFRLSTIGSDSEKRTTTVYRLQCLENCLSGYYAAYGSYPPVSQHTSPNPFAAVMENGVQESDGQENKNIFNWSEIGSQSEWQAWRQVQEACRSQPVGCNYPFPAGYADNLRNLSEDLKQRLEDGDYDDCDFDEVTKNRIMAGFDDGGSGGGTGRFSKNKDQTSWNKIRLFRFGLMSYLLPRYLVMMSADQEFYTGGFAQWDSNNNIPCDPFTGQTFSSWSQVKDISEDSSKRELARLQNIPSQAVCARWMPNLAGICQCEGPVPTLYGISIWDGYGSASLSSDVAYAGTTANDVYTPDLDSSSYKDQYKLAGITVTDGWGREFYYHSPAPHQSYILWSAGANGRTFPPWISRKNLNAKQNECVSKWVSDDILNMSN